MNDPRLTPFNGRVAHISLKGKVNAESFVEGEVREVHAPVADLMDGPYGNRLCQLLYGEKFRVLDDDGSHCFGIRELDGYVGHVSWLHLHRLQRSVFEQTELKVTVPRAPFLMEPDIKSKNNEWYNSLLPYGSVLWHRPFNDEKRETQCRESGWLNTMHRSGEIPTGRFLRWSHVTPIDDYSNDPAGVAELFIHTPYLWGGDSSYGIDCSGLVQRSLTACGKPCPRDSDMQLDAFTKIDATDLSRGDLVFWKGHVGMMLDAERLIHANAHHMMVAIEPLDQAIDRIGKKEFGEVIGFARP